MADDFISCGIDDVNGIALAVGHIDEVGHAFDYGGQHVGAGRGVNVVGIEQRGHAGQQVEAHGRRGGCHCGG